MKSIAHLSDLHFGTVDHNIAEGLIKRLNELQPSVVVISGDFTQRARRNQFIEAREFINRINYELILVPGNHDIPLFDIFRRLFFPLTRYKKYITSDLVPFYSDDEMIILGINTARSFTWKNGRISLEQISYMQKKICPLSNKKIKILVTHHPFMPPPGDAGIALVGRSVKALKIIDTCSVDLLLAGHLHQGYSGDIRTHYPMYKKSVISIQAGTATSRRVRKQNNAFNFIMINKGIVDIEINCWDGKEFKSEAPVSYKRESSAWTE